MQETPRGWSGGWNPEPRAGRRPADPARDGLTARGQQVIGHIGDGRSNAEIAALLVVSPATVKTHIDNAFAKIGAGTRTGAARCAFRAGLATP